jgi:hypothetical protein
MMTHDEMIAVIRAHKEGKTIECRKCGDVRDPWEVAGPTWDFPAFDYRVKPEPSKPREWWLHKDLGNGGGLIVSDVPTQCPCKPIHVREVID